MAHCVNHKHPEVSQLSEQFELSPKAAAAVIAVWQERTGEMDRFPTNKEFSKELEPVSISPDISGIFTEDTELSNVSDTLQKLNKLDKTPQGIGSDKKLNEYLSKEGINSEDRKIIMSLIDKIPQLRKVKLRDILSTYIKEVVKTNEDPYYKAIVSPINTELENILLDYFKPFNITTVELNNLKDRFGVDALGVFDVLNKVVYYAKDRNQFTLPEEFGHVFVELMGTSLRNKDANPTYKFLYENVENWDGYSRVLEQYKDVYTRDDGSPDLIKIKKEAIGQAIGLALVSNVNNKRDTFWTKIQSAIESILNVFKKINYTSFNVEVDSIAKDIINKNYNKLNALKKDLSNYKLLDYAETIENQNKVDGGIALDFMQYFSEIGNIITGSLAYRQQGTVYRPDIDALHDIDMIVPYSTHNIGLMPYRLSIHPSEQAKLLEAMLETDYFKSIKEKYPDMVLMTSYFDKSGKYVTVNGVWSTDNNLSKKFDNLTGSYADRLNKFTKEEQHKIYLFDFFLRDSSEGDVKISEDALYNLKLADSDYAFYEKIGSMRRPKDTFDYQTWKPFDPNKQGVQELSKRMMYYQLQQETTVEPQQTVKEGVAELFESNPELANTVYEALGFKTYRELTLEQENNPFAVFVLVKNPDGTYAATTRAGDRNEKDRIGLPGGKVDPNENPVDAAYRESKEEGFDIKNITGIAASRIVDGKPVVWYYAEIATSLNEYKEKKRGIKPISVSQSKIANSGYGNDFIGKQITPQQKQQAQQLYSQYLNTIFPDSQVKDIVYHGSPKTKLEKIEGISFWTNEKGNAYAYNIERNNDNSEGFVTSAIVNIKNPYIHQEDVNSRFATTTPKDLIDSAKSKNADGAIWRDVEDIAGRETQTIVFEPEQIHILSSKQDIEGFKQFVKDNSTELQLQQIEQELQKEQTPESYTLSYEDSNITALMKEFGISKLPPKKFTPMDLVSARAKEINKVLTARKDLYQAYLGKQVGTHYGQPKEMSVIRFKRNTDKSVVVSDRYGSVQSNEATDFVNTITNNESVDKASQLIDNVLNSEQLTPEVQELLNLIKELGLDVDVRYENTPDSTDLMSTDGTTIIINTAHMAHPKVWAEALVHELVHVTTENALQNNEQFARRVGILYNKYLNKKGDSTSYGFTSPSEFIAELMSNPSFRGEVERLDNIWTRFVRFVSELLGIRGATELDRVSNQIKDIIKNSPTKVEQFKRKAIQFSNDPKESLERLIKSVNSKIKTFQLKNKSATLVAEQQELLGKLAEQYDKANYLVGLNTYADNVHEFMVKDKIFDTVDKLLDAAQQGNFEEIIKTAGRVRDLGTFVFSYEALTEDVLGALAKYKTKDAAEIDIIKGIKEKLSSISPQIIELKRHHADLMHIILSRFLEPFGMGESANQIKDVLTTPVKDINAATRWLMSMQESGDMILGMLDVAFKKFYNDARRESLNISKDLLIAKQELEKKGIKDTEWVYQKDDKGMPTGEFITETAIGEYLDKRNKLYDEVNKFVAEQKEAGIEYSEEQIRSMMYQKTKPLNKQYGVISQKYNISAYDKHIEALRARLGTRFDSWEKMNSHVGREGTKLMVVKRNPQYNALVANADKLDFYWKMVDTKVGLQKQFPMKFRSYRTIPQIRKDVVERLKHGDINRLKDSVTDMFQVKEDDTNYGVDFGIKDERGRVVNFIPIYFTKKLSNMQDLSLDATSSMLIFADMATRRNHLSTIVDVLEIGKEVIKERGVLQTSNRGKILKTISNIMGIKSEESLTKEGSGNVYNRLEDFMDMMLYGKTKVEGKYEEAIDSFVHYTSINNLALNLFAGIANVNMGNILNFIESTSKQFFDVEALAFAKMNYTANTPGVLGDVGNRLKGSKMNLWIEQHNILDDFESAVWGINAQRMTKAEQLTGTSALFVLNTMMEHGLHTEPALALAFNYRYDPSKQKFVFKEDFYRELKDLEEKERLEIKNIKGGDIKNQVKKIRDNYSTKKSKLKESLDTKWKEIKDDNYYNAFEKDKTGKRLVLKSKYKYDVKDANAFENRVHSINHSLAGIYNKLDRSAFQKYAIGRAVFNFRKWMIPGFNKRFKEYYKNYELQAEVEGYYRTSGKFVWQLIKDLKEGQFSIMKNWYSLKDFEKANMRRSMSEMAIFLAAMAVMQALSHIEGDDDDWALNMAAYQSRRLVMGLGAMTPSPWLPGEALKLLDSPIPAANQLSEMKKLLTVWNWFDEIETGKYGGMYKIQKQLIRSIPPMKTIHDVMHPAEKLKFYNKY